MFYLQKPQDVRDHILCSVPSLEKTLGRSVLGMWMDRWTDKGRRAGKMASW